MGSPQIQDGAGTEVHSGRPMGVADLGQVGNRGAQVELAELIFMIGDQDEKSRGRERWGGQQGGPAEARRR